MWHKAEPYQRDNKRTSDTVIVEVPKHDRTFFHFEAVMDCRRRSIEQTRCRGETPLPKGSHNNDHGAGSWEVTPTKDEYRIETRCIGLANEARLKAYSIY